MGEVYSAHDSVRNHAVALKRLMIDATMRHREERMALFHGEYRTLAELEHPCVIRVYDYGVDQAGPYYTMELLEGSDLATDAPLPWRQACSLVRDVCSSLALLHSRGYVHRDVSPLNVRRTLDGRGKLIDFGAMVPMGVSVLTMGTPSCIAPEALRREPLDGRTDLFALGATLYFTLTGRQAFPARHLMELRMLHERTPRPPSAITPDVPPALDRLVSSLLSVDPMARPRHAAEVMERLTTLAELAPIEQVSVHQAYLNTPALVGRDAASQQLAEGVRRLTANRSVVLCVRAAGGGGRSRMLQVGLTEARLLGMTVVSAGASDAMDGHYGVLRALLIELRDTLSSARAALADSPELTSVLEGTVPNDDATTRAGIMKAFSTLVSQISAGQPIMFAVDDIERCDEPSLAAVLTLAAGLRRDPVAVLYSAISDSGTESAGALPLLHELSREIELPPLDEAQTDALLGSVFGQVPNLAVVARYVFDRAAGNPRGTMALAQALVERGLARYELGSWTLPSELAADALPASLSDVRRAELDELPADARELAEVLATAEGYGVPPDEILPLTSHADPERLALAHRALLEARIVDPLDNQALAGRSWVELVQQCMTKESSQQIHARLAKLLVARPASPIMCARCLFRTDDAPRALDHLCGALAAASLVDQADSDYADLLQHALAQCEMLGRPPRDAFFVRRELLALADRMILKGVPACFERVLAQLCHDSGLSDYQRLSHVPESERLTQALTAAQARYDAADERARVLGPIDAIRNLIETVYLGAVYAALIGDPAILRSLPAIDPFVALSPAISSVISAMKAQDALIGARYEEALELYTVRLEQLDHAGLTEAQLARSRPLLHYAMGALQAGLGIEGSLDHARKLDDMPEGQIMAAAVRENYYIRRGNTHTAQQWRRRRELLQIQFKRPHALKLRQATQQLESSAHADDLEETKRNLEALQELAEIYPSLSPYLDYGRAEYERIRGDYAAGLRYVERALAATQAGVHPVWPWAAGCEVECLRELRQLTAAREIGLELVREAADAGLRVMRDHVEVFVSLVEAELGEFDSAVERLDRGIAYRERFGMLGLNIGWSYEARARVALWMRDRPTFERCLARCTESYQGERTSPALALRYEQLVRAAQLQWGALASIKPLVPGNLTMADSTNVGSADSTSWQTFVGQPDRESRAQAALQQFLDLAQCESGRLYLLGENGPELVAGAPDSPAMRALVVRWLGLEDDDSIQTVTGDDDSPESSSEVAAVWPVLLSCMQGNDMATAGVVALPARAAEASSQLTRTARELCRAFIELGDAKPKLQSD